MDRKNLLKSIWSTSEKLGLHNPKESKEKIKESELYLLLYRETKKTSMRECTDSELQRLLNGLKFFQQENKAKTNMITEKQKKYIKFLERKLGWNNNQNRLRGFIKKYAKVDSIDWLTAKHASNVIEGLKKLLKENQMGEIK